MTDEQTPDPGAAMVTIKVTAVGEVRDGATGELISTAPYTYEETMTRAEADARAEALEGALK
jgi:hypothetical protein